MEMEIEEDKTANAFKTDIEQGKFKLKEDELWVLGHWFGGRPTMCPLVRASTAPPVVGVQRNSSNVSIHCSETDSNLAYPMPTQDDRDTVNGDTICLEQEDYARDRSGDKLEEDKINIHSWGPWDDKILLMQTQDDPDAVSGDTICLVLEDYDEDRSHNKLEVDNVSVHNVKTASYLAFSMQTQETQTIPRNYPERDSIECDARFEAGSGQPRNQQDADPQANISVTTKWIGNIPNDYSREDALLLFGSDGFLEHMNFFYLPFDFGKGANLGYGFADFTSPEVAEQFQTYFGGLREWDLAPGSDKICVVNDSPIQGLKAIIERYRNSPVMHNSVLDEHKPILLKNGRRIPFPRRTKKRLRKPQPKNA